MVNDNDYIDVTVTNPNDIYGPYTERVGFKHGDEDYFYTMVNIHPNDTGLKTLLHAWGGSASKGLPSGPIVKVSTNQHGRLPIQLKPEVKLAVQKNLTKEDEDIVNNAILYTSSNIDLFQKHWDGEIDDFELLNILPRHDLEHLDERIERGNENAEA